jgi:hypothetical protein
MATLYIRVCIWALTGWDEKLDWMGLYIELKFKKPVYDISPQYEFTMSRRTVLAQLSCSQ